MIAVSYNITYYFCGFAYLRTQSNVVGLKDRPVASVKTHVKSEHDKESSKSVLKHEKAVSVKKPVKSEHVKTLSKPVSKPKSPSVLKPLKPASASEPELVVPAWALDQAFNAAKHISGVYLWWLYVVTFLQLSLLRYESRATVLLRKVGHSFVQVIDTYCTPRQDFAFSFLSS